MQVIAGELEKKSPPGEILSYHLPDVHLAVAPKLFIFRPRNFWRHNFEAIRIPAMAVSTKVTTTVTSKHPQETPYQLDPEQVRS
jgi:hypothetical protein